MMDAHPLLAEETVCANVRIEIQQDVAFERQAFLARMKIKNSLASIPLTDIRISVWVKDQQGTLVETTSDPNNTTAKFFIRIDALRNINNITGTGTIQPTAEAEMHWLLIPSRGAAAESVEGKIYYVGATLSYKVSGDLQEVDVAPDLITVKPQPELILDYFLTRDVRADDPLTQAIEPAEPFTLGVRIKNNGLGIARRMSIDSAQPKIVQNELGLLIGFRIIGSTIQDKSTTPSLLLQFGDIAGGQYRVGRWLMETSLAGRFESFSARFIHSDEFGGNLTSLLSDVRTHFLIHDVVVDLPGRDVISDFLALDDSLVRVYESEGIDTTVTNYSDVATFRFISESNGTQLYRFTMPVFTGPAYASVADPFQGTKEIQEVIRADAKVIPSTNAWFATTGVGNNSQYAVRLFDSNGGGDYFFKVRNKSASNKPPVIQFIPDRTGMEGNESSFIVVASDPNGTIPKLSLDAKPSGSTFTDKGDGTGSFKWTPTQGQKGRYTLTFRASDGELSSARTAGLRIFMAGDSDGDDMLDSWEIFFFGNLQRDGTGDYDNDGASDLTEFLRDSDPTFAGDIPTVPVIDSPLDGTSVTTVQPKLTVKNSSHGLKPATYDFELFKESSFTTLLSSKYDVAEGQATTSWALAQNLADNTRFYWRARAKTSYAKSQWVHGSFFVNTANDPPLPFSIDSPKNGEVVATLTPILAVANSSDPDGDVITYGFEVRLGSSTGTLITSMNGVAQHSSGITSWLIPVTLTEDSLYVWRATATDALGLSTSTTWSSFIPSLANNAPSPPLPIRPEDGVSVASTTVELVALPGLDPEHQTVKHYFEFDTVNTFNSTNLISSGPIDELSGEVRFTVSNLKEDTLYFWRVKANDSLLNSAWATSSLRVNTQNQAPSVPGVLNPGMGSTVTVLDPMLQLTQSTDPDGETVRYQFEVYADAALLKLIASKTTSATSWTVAPQLSDNTKYFWRARALDPNNLASAWTSVLNFFVNYNSVNDIPTFDFIEPLSSTIPAGKQLLLRWSDADPDSNAKITLYANSIVLASALQEDPDDKDDTYIWNTQGITPGSYQLKAVIADEDHSITKLGAIVTINNTEPLNQDSDGDRVPDSKDNCPYFSNTSQRDSGSLLSKAKDRIGNACQCGDVNGDGIINAKDPVMIRKTLRKGSKIRMKRPDLCHVGGTKGCTVKDALLIEKAILRMQQYLKSKVKKGRKPKLPQVCRPAKP
jgi:hypothetical protein